MDYEIRNVLSCISGSRSALEEAAEKHWKDQIRPAIQNEAIAAEAMAFVKQHEKQPAACRKAINQALLLCPAMAAKLTAYREYYAAGNPTGAGDDYCPPLGKREMSRFISGTTAHGKMRSARRTWVYVLRRYLDWRCGDA